jgi:hydroxyacylglutathione hydrolase
VHGALLGVALADRIDRALDEPLAAFLDRPDLVAQASRLTATEFDARRREVPHLQVVDVRGPSEVEHGIIDSAVTIQLPQLVDRLGELDPAGPTVVYCAGGYRSSIAASTLRAHGFTDVSDILGGYGAWAGRDTA